MKIAPVKSLQNFKALDCYYVCVADEKKFIKDNIKQLNQLGENYDIILTSLDSKQPNVAILDIDVKPLKKGMSFFKSLFRPTGNSTFCALYDMPDDKLKIKEEFMGKVKEAIADLNKKVKLHK